MLTFYKAYALVFSTTKATITYKIQIKEMLSR